jgi:hypothetical protein
MPLLQSPISTDLPLELAWIPFPLHHPLELLEGGESQMLLLLLSIIKDSNSICFVIVHQLISLWRMQGLSLLSEEEPTLTFQNLHGKHLAFPNRNNYMWSFEISDFIAAPEKPCATTYNVASSFWSIRDFARGDVNVVHWHMFKAFSCLPSAATFAFAPQVNFLKKTCSNIWLNETLHTLF